MLRSNGQLRIIVKGLVLADDPVVPAALRLTNPVPFFKGVVSCQSIGTDPEGHPIPTTINVSTDPFPASPAGDSKIKATVDLPWPCFAPIVFVTNPGGSWFAVTGR